MRHLALPVGFVVGVGVGAGGCYLYLQQRKPVEAPVKGAKGSVIQYHVAQQYGIPQTDVVRYFDSYVAAYDYRTRNPKWVLEHITQQATTGDGDRQKSEFFEDKEVDPLFRSKLSDYRGSGYDRGHMAPAANHKDSQKGMDDTFCLTNISPQVGEGFNRDYWARLEKLVRDTTRHFEHVYTLTGPLWLPTLDGEGKWTLQHPLIGQAPQLVSVPTHYFKVVLATGKKKASNAKTNDNRMYNDAVAAFVIPNQVINDAHPLSAYVVPLSDLEAVSGMKVFPYYFNNSKKRALDVAAAGWRHYGMQQIKPFERVTMQQVHAALPAPSTPAAPPALPAPQATAGSNARPSLPLPPPAVGAQGTAHLCELNACKLPAPLFWNKQKAAAKPED